MKRTKLNIRGEIIEYQTDIKTGKVIPGTYKRSRNTITDSLKNYLAQAIADGAADKAIDLLFGAQGDITAAGTANDGKDGIAHGSAATKEVTHFFVTSKNAGGDGNVSYVEFYGYIDGAVNLTDSLLLGYAYSNVTYTFAEVMATYAINTSVASGRRYHFYWKITIS